MIELPMAITRGDVADYVSALAFIYTLMIIGRIVIGWVVTARGSLPYWGPLRAVTNFIEEVVDPYLNLFRGLIPPIGGGRMALDLTPIIALLLLGIVSSIVVGLIRG